MLGCGPGVNAPDEVSTETGTAGSGPGSTDEAGESTAGPDVGAADGTTAGPTSCGGFDDEYARDAEMVVFEIHNVGDQPFLLDSPCQSWQYLELTTASGWRWPGEWCTSTCEQELRFGCDLMECDGCGPSYYTVVMPGERVEARWAGMLHEELTPPTECWLVEQCAPTCSRLRVPTTEEITATVSAITQADCIAAEPDPSVCECAAPGRCEAYGQVSVVPTLSATTTLTPGTTGPIVLEMEG